MPSPRLGVGFGLALKEEWVDRPPKSWSDGLGLAPREGWVYTFQKSSSDSFLCLLRASAVDTMLSSDVNKCNVANPYQL